MFRRNVDIVLGTQFGDEGKGKIVDFLCSSGEYDLCVRVNGSDNAGHTSVSDEGVKIAFRQVPVGAAHGIWCAIARGCIVNLPALEEELKVLSPRFPDLLLFLDSRCHLKTEEHISRDREEESTRERPIGTTLSGNGPAYADKYARKNLRVCDVDLSSYRYIKKHVIPCDVSTLISCHKIQKKVLVEGAHGILLDIDHGTYPFVTSSACTSGAACHSLGIGPHQVGRVIGVVKPYSTRVGAGAMPAEILDTYESSFIREIGHEYGTNTGRARRIGWLDLPELAYSVRVGGITEIALTKVDLLQDIIQRLGGIKVCSLYQKEGMFIPARDEEGALCEPKYEVVSGIEALSTIISLIEEASGVPVAIVSHGHRRGDTKTRLSCVDSLG
jgi:adenylosuccinate synthase